MPPPVDTCHFPRGSGNGCTTISKRPDSLVSYATHCPSGENCPLSSSYGVWTTTIGFLSLPVTGSESRSRPFFGSISEYRMNRPSFDQSFTYLLFAFSSNNSSAPAPLDGFVYRLKVPFLFESNAIRIPSGDQTELMSFPGSNVNRVVPPLTTS